MYQSLGDYGTFYRYGNICQYIVTKAKQKYLDNNVASKLDSIPNGYIPVNRTLNRLSGSGGLIVTSMANEIVMLNNTGSTVTIGTVIGDNITYYTEDNIPQ